MVDWNQSFDMKSNIMKSHVVDEIPRHTWEKPEATKFLKKYNESNDLQSLSSMITQMERIGQERVKSGRYQGWNLADIKRQKDAILAGREVDLPLPPPIRTPSEGQLQEGRKRLKKSPARKRPAREPSPLEKAYEQISSRRPAVAGNDDDDDDNDVWDVGDEEWMEESGASHLGVKGDFETMIHDLYVMLGSLRAGNSSTKLRRDIEKLLSELTRRGFLTKAQGRKIFRDYIG